MYREEDIEVIKSNIDNIAENAMHIYKSNNEPTLEESKAVYKIILDFIKNKKRIIYGGYAQNKLIIEKNKDDGFYKDIDTPDIEFYTYTPLSDLIELCDGYSEVLFEVSIERSYLYFPCGPADAPYAYVGGKDEG